MKRRYLTSTAVLTVLLTVPAVATAQERRGPRGDNGGKGAQVHSAPRAENRAEGRAVPRTAPPAAVAPRAEVARPQVVRPEVVRPNVTRPAVVAPNVARPYVTTPHVAHPYYAPNYAPHYAPHYYAPYHYYARPYYSGPYVYRPHFSIGFGIWAGYPVPYSYAYPYPVPVYGYGAPTGTVNVGPSSTQYGGVALEITPGEASVYVDGGYAGLVRDFDGTKQTLTLAAGHHRIDINAQGFEPMSFEVDTVPGQIVPYRGDLQPAA
jgi:hypothetical protein